MAKYNIGGYIFDDENKAKKAAKELRSVEYLLSQIKDADEKGVLTVYKKLINQRLFSTEIGMGFLTQLRKNLLQSEAFTEADVPPVYSLNEEKNKPDKTKQKDEIADKVVVDKPKVVDSGEIKRLKFINKILIILCITLALIVIGMFYVNSTINSPTILNYEEQLLNKYSSWEQELSEREAAVKEKELSQQ